MIEAADAERLARVLGTLDKVSPLLASLMAHSRVPDKFPAARLASLGPIAETVEEEVQQARATLGRLLPDAPAARPSFDLSTLAELDAGKPQALKLIASLRDLLPLALELDTARGRVVSAKVPLQPGETPSVDVAEILSDLCARLESEAGIGVGMGRE